MPSTGLEPTIVVMKRFQTYTLDRTTFEIVSKDVCDIEKNINFGGIKTGICLKPLTDFVCGNLVNLGINIM